MVAALPACHSVLAKIPDHPRKPFRTHTWSSNFVEIRFAVSKL